MTPSNVHILHPTSPPLAGFLRVGHTGHHKLEALRAADRLGFGRLVFDAAHASEGDQWRSVDIRATERQRMELDSAGAKDVAIDHLVLIGALHEADGAAAPTSASPLFRGSRPGSGGMSVIQGGRP